MNFELIKASEKHREVIKNLMQYYMYDFAEYLNTDVEENGLFAAYPDLEVYWKEATQRFPYVITKDKNYVGFVLVRCIEPGGRNYFSVAEFFIMKKYRLRGVGKAIATQVFNIHKGEWEVFQKESNKPAQLFWSKVIDDYTKGKFSQRIENGRRIQSFKTS